MVQGSPHVGAGHERLFRVLVVEPRVCGVCGVTRANRGLAPLVTPSVDKDSHQPRFFIRQP